MAGLEAGGPGVALREGLTWARQAGLQGEVALTGNRAAPTAGKGRGAVRKPGWAGVLGSPDPQSQGSQTMPPGEWGLAPLSPGGEQGGMEAGFPQSVITCLPSGISGLRFRGARTVTY